MQSLALENYGTSELSFDEQRETDGGNPVVVAWWAGCAAAIVAGAVIEIIQDWDGLKAGLAGKREPSKS
jgi:hypothetical protein